MEEALSILWTYARRQPIESNGKTIVATISQSIAAICIIMRLEGWLQKSEKVKDKSEKPAAPAVATSVCRGERQFPRWCGLVARTSSLMQAYGSSPHKVSSPYSYIAADLHKNAPLMEPPMIRHHVANDNYRDDGERLISSRPPPF